MKAKYSILILGANTMQLPAIRIAKARGWHVLVADRNPAAPGVSLADHFLEVDLQDRTGMLQAASVYHSRHHLDGVFTAGTDFSTTVAYVAEQLGLPGIPYEVALAATDKARMRARFQEAGVPAPAFLVVQEETQLGKVLETLALPLVLKPVDNMGARGVCRIDRAEELRPAFLKAREASRSGKVIIEEYLQGREYSLDALVYAERITICGIADRQIYFSPHFVELGHIMPTVAPPAVQEQLVAVFTAGIRALGIDYGAAKGDIFMTPQGPRVGEIAARLSGGYMSGWTYPLASGVEPTAAALNLAVGLPPGDLQPAVHMHSAERAFISLPGTIASQQGLAEARRLPACAELFSLKKAGDQVVFPSNNVEKCGNVITRATTREAAIQAAEEALQLIHIRLRPDNHATERFLFGPARPGEYPAFTVENPTLLTQLERMPLFTGSDLECTYISVLPFPALLRETGRDWHGFTLQAAVNAIMQLAGRDIFQPLLPGEIRLGRHFWVALLRGGYQGGLYLLDTLASLAGKSGQLSAKLEDWAERC